MNAPALLRALTVALALALISCNKPMADKDAIFGVVHEHIHAFQKKDVETVMATIHPESPAYEATKAAVGEMFKTVDLKYELSDLHLESATPEEMKVSFKQKTTKIGGTGQFMDNIVEGVHTLRRDKETWKIFKTLQLKITDLQGKPLFVSPEPAPASPIEPAGQSPAATPPQTPAAPAPAPATPPAP